MILNGKFEAPISRISAEERGFTLAEVAIAVAILGLGMTTLIVLQTRYMDSYVYERNLTRAALVSQYLMTMIEVQGETPDVGTSEESVPSALDRFGYFDAVEFGKNERDEFQNWTATTEVSSVELYEFSDAIRRIDLTVRWSESSRDSFSLSYFILNAEGLNALRQAVQ